jgi:protein-L-isoaspartate O-methyltransferase
VQALGLRAGSSVVDIACGTGLNFALIEKVIGPGGRIVGVDLTHAMLARAKDRIEAYREPVTAAWARECRCHMKLRVCRADSSAASSSGNPM